MYRIYQPIVDVSIPASVGVCPAAFVAKVGIFVSVNAAVSLADPVEVDMLEVWLGVVTLDVVIVNAESVVLATDGIISDALLMVLRFVVVAAVTVVVPAFRSVAFRLVVGMDIDVAWRVVPGDVGLLGLFIVVLLMLSTLVVVGVIVEVCNVMLKSDGSPSLDVVLDETFSSVLAVVDDLVG